MVSLAKRRVRLALAGSVALAVVSVGALVPPTGVARASQPSLVRAVPSATPPNVADGRVTTIARVGGTVVVGGTFTTVDPHGGKARARHRLFAFDASSGAVLAHFKPTVDGAVHALLPGPRTHTVYVGGAFDHVNGKAAHGVALLDTRTGKRVSGFHARVAGSVRALRRVGHRLLLGGTFRKVDGLTHAGLASVDARTGEVERYLSVQLSGHHNYGGMRGQDNAPVGARAMDVSPDHSTLVVVGNFTTADGRARDQIVRIALGSKSGTVDRGWATSAYTPQCHYWSYDSYVRDVAFAPSGSYFVVAATGGPTMTTTACDAVARFDTSASGSDVAPAWVAHTGGDSMLSVAVTKAAVYAGGHQRWLNNPTGQDNAGPGAVPRPGIAALDPRSGVPFAWNPARNPRGKGAGALLATHGGLYVGSDTSYIGNRKYHRGKIAYFPAGGHQISAEHTGSLPGTVYLVRADGSLVKRSFDGTQVGNTKVVRPSGWASARGAFMVSGTLFSGRSDGWLVRRGAHLGHPAEVDPYDNPAWADVQTGSGQTYRGAPPDLYGAMRTVTGMAYAHGRLYYTQSGRQGLYSRAFNPASGVMGEVETQVASGAPWSHASGLLLVHGSVYVGSALDGNLRRLHWSHGAPSGSATVVSGPSGDGTDWRGYGLFLYVG